MIISLLSALLTASAAPPAWEKVVDVPEVWRFRLDPRDVGVRERWQSSKWLETATRIKVGQWWEPQGHAYDGYAWYRVQVDIPQAFQRRRIVVRFGAVDEDAWVYWNGRLSGSHSGWNQAFEVDVSQWVKCGERNTLVVRVLDTMMMGGIWQPVTIVSPKAQREPAFVARLRKEGVRLAHLSGRAGSVEGMAEVGCNVAMHNTWALTNVEKTTPADSEEIVRESDLEPLAAKLEYSAPVCKKSNQIALCAIYGLSRNQARILKQHKYRLFVDAAGTRGEIAPCPLSRRYWFGLLLPQLRIQARVLKAEGISGGAVLDLEFYGARDLYPGWWKRDLCYCDNCWDSFRADTPQDEDVSNVPVEQRGTWVHAHGIRDDYHGLLARRLEALMRELAGKCRDIHPDFLLGLYPYVAHWANDAILRGWSTPELPSLAMSEWEYSDGFGAQSEENTVHLNERGINALYIGGLIQGRCLPQLYAAKAEELASRADGYWLYYAAMFFDAGAIRKLKPPDQGNEYSLAAPPREYLDALAAANARLDKERGVHGTFPRLMDLTKRLKEAGDPSTSSAKPVSIANPGFESALAQGGGWTSAYGLPERDQIAHSGKWSAKLEPKTHAAQGFLNVVQPVEFDGDADYVIQLWARTKGPVDGWGMGLLILPSRINRTFGHYVPLPADSQDWTLLRQRLHTLKVTKHGLLNIHIASPRATVWIDDVAILPAGGAVWETGPIDIPAESRLGRLRWTTDLAEQALLLSVHDAASGELLHRSRRSGIHLSRLDLWPRQEFLFRATYDGTADRRDCPVSRLWLEMDGRE